ncbi:MAG: YqgE/AlgH family protein [Gammaproteobacteria bacterium]|nr:YqgE/AlgH family protein [Gammaproteobacteria bacterium]
MPPNVNKGNYFENQFLVSTPQLDDPNFRQTVILLCKHDDEGAMGIVVNRLSGHSARDVFEQLEIVVPNEVHTQIPVHNGGPVHPELGLIVHTDNPSGWESTVKMGGGLSLTSSKDILCDIARGDGPDRALLSLGYAGWKPGQLEHEIYSNYWFTTPADHGILFAPEVDSKWEKAAGLIGIDTRKYFHQIGHA